VSSLSQCGFKRGLNRPHGNKYSVIAVANARSQRAGTRHVLSLYISKNAHQRQAAIDTAAAKVACRHQLDRRRSALIQDHNHETDQKELMC